MNKIDNLKKGNQATQFKKGSKKAVECGRKGGRSNKSTTRLFKDIAKQDIDDATANEMIIAQIDLARTGDRGALEFLLKLLGQHPDQEQTADSNITIRFEGGDEYGD